MMHIGKKLLIAGGTGLLIPMLAYGWYFQDALFAPAQSFAATRAVLLPHLQMLLPEAGEPHPAVLLFHGCGGPKVEDLERAGQLTRQGYVAILVDSYSGRNIDIERSCAGRILPGNQRAADVLVALDFARQQAAVDPDRLFIMGYSHGAWSILEALAAGDRLPPKLSDSPGAQLAGLRGVIAWYPYCGIGTDYAAGWHSEVPVLMLLAEQDQTTDPLPCIAVAQAQQAQGEPVSWLLYPGVDHGFDRPSDWVRLYDPAIAQQALQAQNTFLRDHAG